MIEKEDEISCAVGGCNFLLRAIGHEAFTFQNGCSNFLTFPSERGGGMRIGSVVRACVWHCSSGGGVEALLLGVVTCFWVCCGLCRTLVKGWMCVSHVCMCACVLPRLSLRLFCVACMCTCMHVHIHACALLHACLFWAEVVVLLNPPPCARAMSATMAPKLLLAALRKARRLKRMQHGRRNAPRSAPFCALVSIVTCRHPQACHCLVPKGHIRVLASTPLPQTRTYTHRHPHTPHECCLLLGKHTPQNVPHAPPKNMLA